MEERVERVPQPVRLRPDYRAEVTERLRRRGVTIRDIAEIVQQIQAKYVPGITLEQCEASVEAVIAKREVQHALLTGIALDEAAEKGLLEEPLLSILRTDEPLYGVDEVLALAITNVYGSIGLTNFGYLDKVKLGVIERLNSGKSQGHVHTFLDDLVAGIAAAAAARLAHNEP
ncbi:MAG: phosphatidylglycerophosphatase A [Symbiobacteriaceae bacterium]|nr:MAG: phosphatidylglycerophosphatase A [Bacillota bacterium]